MKRSPKKEARFLSELAAGNSITAACRAIGIGRPAAYQWRKDPTFAKRWEDALEAGADLLEDELKRRAVDGVEEPVFYQGKIVGHVHKYSDNLLMFRLKALRPNKYRDVVRVENIDCIATHRRTT
jgi:hypothetical protein